MSTFVQRCDLPHFLCACWTGPPFAAETAQHTISIGMLRALKTTIGTQTRTLPTFAVHALFLSGLASLTVEFLSHSQLHFRSHPWLLVLCLSLSCANWSVFSWCGLAALLLVSCVFLPLSVAVFSLVLSEAFPVPRPQRKTLLSHARHTRPSCLSTSTPTSTSAPPA
jgi:hypothetical protein